MPRTTVVTSELRSKLRGGVHDEEDADSLFPGIVDAAMKAFRFAYPMPADVIDPWTGEETQISNLGEVMRGKIFVAALEDQAYLRYDSLLRLLVTETIQA